MAKGFKSGGRKKGTPNKVTSTAREAFLAMFHRLSPNIEGWIAETAEKDPGKAAELVLRMAEYHFPKLGRQELTGKDGEPIRAVFRIEE